MTTTIDRETALARVRSFLGRMEAGDYAGIAAMLAPDAVVEMPNTPEPYRLVGRDTVRETFERTVPLILSQIAFTIERMAFDPEEQRVVAEYRSTAVRAGGGAYANRYIATWDFAGGQITEWREYFNPLQL